MELNGIYSSLCKRLHVIYPGMKPSSLLVEGVVEVVLDAVKKGDVPLDEQRLFSWHRTLFPTGRSGFHDIHAGCYRSDSLEVVAGEMAKTRIIYEAPPAKNIPVQMKTFLTWLNADMKMPVFIKSAIAHLWFVTIHPFEDGNGRIARAIGDYALGQGARNEIPLVIFSSRIKMHREEYHAQINQAQTGDTGITQWLLWYETCLLQAYAYAIDMLSHTVTLQKF